MAKIQTETLTFTFSKLVKDLADTNEPTAGIVNAEMLEGLNAVAEELAGSGVIVEVSWNQ
jgi:hypothetical protein